jgi:arabinofuranan 3-O-arabinosyltransferase
MESRDRGAQALADEATHRVARTWLRVAAGCALLVGIAFIQAPGLMVADTKFDLAVDPAGFLGRALHLWDDEGAFGQLQNQAYGYLFPMGPFFALCQVAGVPAWVAQRLWGAVLLSAAFGGALLLARAMKLGTERTRLIGALGYALAPRMLTEIGGLSA